MFIVMTSVSSKLRGRDMMHYALSGAVGSEIELEL